MKNKTGAMEMSVGTIVTIVLLMSVLVLGLILVQRIFGSASNAIDTVDNQIQNEITKVFQDVGGTLAIYPSSRDITLKKKDDTPKGFAFAVRNDGQTTKTFSYKVYSEDVSKCSGFTKANADSLLLGASGSFQLRSGEDTVSSRDIVKFILNEDVPLCTMVYRIKICEGSTCTATSSNPYDSQTITVTVK
jgi:hypothetical protein